MSPRREKKAFTLVEVLTVAVIFSVFSAGLYSIFNVGLKSWQVYNANAGAQREVRQAASAMTKELHKARGVIVTSDDRSVRINFIIPSRGAISYLWEKDGRNANQIIRIYENKQKVLARDISALSFNYLADAVVVDMTARKKPALTEPAYFHLKIRIARRL